MKRFKFEGTTYDNAEVIRETINDLYHLWHQTEYTDKSIEKQINTFEKAVNKYIYELLFILTVDNAKAKDKGTIEEEIISLMRQVDFIENQYVDKAVGDYDLDEHWVEVSYYFQDPKDSTLYYGMAGIETPYDSITEIKFFAARAHEETIKVYQPI